MKNSRILIALLMSTIVLAACNKEKRYSQKLMKGEVWNVMYVQVNGEAIDFKGQWLIESDVNIYDSVPTIEWTLDEKDAFFEWQFQDKGKSFQLNYNQLCSEADGSLLDTLDHIGYDLTGSYAVERHGRNKMEFISSETLGYGTDEVKIYIERVK